MDEMGMQMTNYEDKEVKGTRYLQLNIEREQITWI